MIRLTERERQIIRAAHLYAREPIVTLASRLGMRPHTVRHSLQRLLREGVIRAVPFVDNYRLGYKTYQVLFTLSSDPSRGNELFRTLEQSPRTAWLAEMGGDFHYGARICARDERDLLTCLDRLERGLQECRLTRSSAAVVHFWVFPKKYLWPSEVNNDVLSIGQSSEVRGSDEVDRAILSKLAEYSLPSHHEIGRRLSLPRSTVDYRVSRLESDGIIAGYLYLVSALSMGMLPYRVLINVAGGRTAIKEKLLAYAQHHPSVVNFSECLGGWDFEASIEVERPHETATIVQDMQQRFQPKIAQLRVVPVFRQLQSKNFLRFTGVVAERQQEVAVND